MVVFAALFWYICDPQEYLHRHQDQQHAKHEDLPPKKNPLLALLDSSNLWDIIAGMGRLFSISMYLQRTGGWAGLQKARQAKKQMKKDKRSKFFKGAYNKMTRGEINPGNYVGRPPFP
jgi:hypothetical protein